MRSKMKIGAASRTLMVIALMGGGCQIAQVPDSLTAKYGASDEDSQMEFWHQLAEKPLASNDEAAHALLLFAGEKEPGSTYEARVGKLKEKGLLPGRFNAPASEAVKRGTVAYALCKALNIRGGVTMSLFGTHERYATRELVDAGLFPTSSPDQTFSGTELVGIIGKAEDYQRGGAGEKTPGSLASDPK